MSAALTFLVFWGLVAHAASSPERRAQMRRKPIGDWALEIVSLLVQGALIPLILVVMLIRVWGYVLPSLGGALHLSPVVAFLVSFVGVDYLYYWNHRLLHTRALWPLHLVHHTSPSMDVFATSRNTVWTSFLIVYVWANSFFVYALNDPRFFLAGAAATAILDLARHSALRAPEARWFQATVGYVLVLPHDHAWHHARDAEHGNYAANLKLWDRLHGTYLGARPPVTELGVDTNLSLARRFAWPFSRTS